MYLDKTKLYEKLKRKETEVFDDEECEWITYFESLKSRSDSEHSADPLVGALVRDKNGHILEVSHRASGQEGDHAEFTLLKGRLVGKDLTGCVLFTTLEPCVDDVRSGIGKSCSSIICKSEIKEVHIGILDPNMKVYMRGVEELFKHGVAVKMYSSKEVIYEIYESCPVFRNPTNDENTSVERFKSSVLKYFDQNALQCYLQDCYYCENKTLDGFVLENRINDFALELIRKEYISFNARDIFVDDSIKLLFYANKYLPHTMTREIKIKDNTNALLDNAVNNIDYPLPLIFHYMDDYSTNVLKMRNLDKEIFREAIANLLIHRTYSSNDGLGYFEVTKQNLFLKNEASKDISKNELNKLPSFEATTHPGNGLIAHFFDRAGYCERNQKGQNTFKNSKGKVIIKVSDDRFVELQIKRI